MKPPVIVVVIGTALTLAAYVYWYLRHMPLDVKDAPVVAGVSLALVALVRWMIVGRKKKGAQS